MILNAQETTISILQSLTQQASLNVWKSKVILKLMQLMFYFFKMNVP